MFRRLLFLIFLAGCGSKQEGVTLQFLEAPDAGGAWKEIIRGFEKENPGIRVKMVEGPAATNTREDMYTASFLAGESSYDMVYMDVAWVAKFASQNWLLPLESFDERMREDFMPGDLEGSRFKGKFYRLPMQSDVGILYYRKDLLDSKGIKAPRSFEELIKTAKEFHNPPALYGYVFQGKQYEGLSCNFFEFFWGSGGDLLDKKGNLSSLGAAGVRAAHHLRRITVQEKLAPPGVLVYQEEESRRIFQEGKSVFMRNWPYAYTLMQAADSPVRGKVGIALMPHEPGAQPAATLGGWGFGISRFSKHPQEAWKFIEYATGASPQKVRFSKAGILPARRSLYKDAGLLKEAPHLKEIYPVLLSAKPRPMHPGYPRISDIIQRNVSAVLAGIKTPEQAIKEADLQLQAVR